MTLKVEETHEFMEREQESVEERLEKLIQEKEAV